MIVMGRTQFMQILAKGVEQGKAYVLGTCTGAAGLLTYQGVNVKMAYVYEERKIPIDILVRGELLNIFNNCKYKTGIHNYVPLMIDDMSDEEREDMPEKAVFKKMRINSETASIEVADNGSSILITSNDNSVFRCIDGRGYGSMFDYRTTYYFGGNVKLNDKNYCYIAECIETKNGDYTYLPSFFVIYAIETDKVVELPVIRSSLMLKVREILDNEEEKEEEEKEEKKKYTRRKKNGRRKVAGDE